MDFIIIFFIISLLIILLKKHKSEEYFSVNKTNSINGIFVLFVFFRHFGQYISLDNYDYYLKYIDSRIGQLIVTSFLFFTGYGLMYSIERKKKYLDKFYIKFLKLLVHYDFVILIYFIINIILNNKMTGKDLFLALLAWKSIGNSNWYIFAIFYIYLMIILSRIVLKNKFSYYWFFIFVSCIIYVLFMMYFEKKQYYYDTIFCVPFGMFFEFYYEKKIRNILENYRIRMYLLIFTSLFFLLVYKCCSIFNQYTFDIVLIELKSILFILLIILVLFKFNFSNFILIWLGDHVFEIYIIQRIPMMVLQKLLINRYIYFIGCFVITIILAYVLKLLFKILDTIFFENKFLINGKKDG